ncbi:MAG: hypothetical protein ACOY8P_06775 [Thermodesulfobacteriota bacterium]
MFGKKYVRGIVLGLAGLGMVASTAVAEEAKPTADLTVSALSQYVWRGFAYSKDSIVLQPSMTVGYKGFSANVWGNLDTDRWEGTDVGTDNWTETDLTLSYSWTMGPASLSAGYIYYALDPYVSTSDTQELFLSATLNTLLSPTLKVYRDIDHFAGWYATLGVSHSLPIKGDIALTLGAQASYLAADEASSYADPDDATDEYNNFHDGLLSASVKIPVNQYVSVTPQVYYSFPLSSDAEDLLKATNATNAGIGRADDNFVYGGVAVSLAF